MQKKTFTNWINSKLSTNGYEPIENLSTDLSDGVCLARLLESIGKGPVKYNKRPISRIVKMENLSYILSHIRFLNIHIVNIGPEDIVDGNEKLILGLIWTIIAKISLSDIITKIEEYNNTTTIREALLEWTKMVTEPYENVDIKDFTYSWKNGLAFNAIIHRFRPELVPNYHLLDSSNDMENLTQAFEIAENSLKIPKLLDPKDILISECPDEKSMITYVSQYYQSFNKEIETIVRRNKAIKILQKYEKKMRMIHLYEKRAKEFVSEKERCLSSIKSAQELVESLANAVKNFDRSIMKLSEDSIILSEIFGNIKEIEQDKHFGNMKKYIPEEDLEPEKLSINYGVIKESMSLTPLQNSLDMYESGEIRLLEELGKKTKKIAEIADFNMIGELVMRINVDVAELKKGPFCFTEEQKRITGLIEETICKKQEKAKKIYKNPKELSEKIEKMFKISDTKRTGFITNSDAKKIMTVLKLRTECLNTEDGKLVTLDSLLNAAEKAESYDSEYTKKILESLVGIRIADVFPRKTFKYVPIDKDGCIESLDVLNIE